MFEVVHVKTMAGREIPENHKWVTCSLMSERRSERASVGFLQHWGGCEKQGERGWKRGPLGDHGQMMLMLRKEVRSALEILLHYFHFKHFV